MSPPLSVEQVRPSLCSRRVSIDRDGGQSKEGLWGLTRQEYQDEEKFGI